MEGVHLILGRLSRGARASGYVHPERGFASSLPTQPAQASVNAMGDYGDAYMRKDLAGPPGRTKAQNRATVQQLKLVRSSFCSVFCCCS